MQPKNGDVAAVNDKQYDNNYPKIPSILFYKDF